MDVVLLGTGSPLPDPNRAGPSTLVRGATHTFLVDAGRGVLMRAAAVGSGAAQLDAVLLTHLHSDHITDLSDLITSRWVVSFTPSPLVVYGPPRTREVVDAILASLRPDIGFRVGHHADLTWEPLVEVHEVTTGVIFQDRGTRVVAGPTDHRPVTPTVGYRIEQDGKVVVLAGDTVPCAGLDALCDGADALVHTVIRDDLIHAIGVPRMVDVCDYHSTVAQAADTAVRAGVGTLILTHYFPGLMPGDEDSWRALARPHFTGPVELGDDLLTVSL